MGEQDELLLTRQEQLDVLADYGCFPDVEVIPAPEIDDALCKAQLAKAKQHYEQDTASQLIRLNRGKAGLDRPELREKIHDYLTITFGKFYEAKHKRNFYAETDPLVALIEPLIEEAKKQERERILKLLRTKYLCSYADDSCIMKLRYIDLTKKGQALKEEKEEINDRKDPS